MIHLLLIDLTIVPLSVGAAAVWAIIGGKHVDGQQAGLSASEETAASQSASRELDRDDNPAEMMTDSQDYIFWGVSSQIDSKDD